MVKQSNWTARMIKIYIIFASVLRGGALILKQIIKYFKKVD